MNIATMTGANAFGRITGLELYQNGCTKSRVVLAISRVNADTTGSFTRSLQAHMKNGTANGWLGQLQRQCRTEHAC